MRHVAPLLLITLLACGKTEPPAPTPQTGTTVDNIKTPQAATAVITTDGGTARHPDGITVHIPQGVFEKETKLTVTRDVSERIVPNVTLRGPVVDIQTDLPPGTLLKKPVEITIPFQGNARGVTGAVWSGRSWVPVGSIVNEQAKTVTIQTMHFSSFGVVEDQFPNEPTVNTEDEDPKRDVPRGGLVRINVPDATLSKASAGDILARFDKGVLISADPYEAKGFADVGPGTVSVVGSRGRKYASILAFVKDDTELGERELTLTQNGQEIARIPKAIRVVRRVAIVIDIDGLRQDVFYAALGHGAEGISYPSELVPTNLRNLFGDPGDEATIGSLRVLKSAHGLAVQNAVTIFPSYTFAGHAAIFTGHKPGEYGMPGNEWFDRKMETGRLRRYAFTGGTLGGPVAHYQFMDTVSSYGAAGLANTMLRTDTVYDEIGKEGIMAIVGFNMYFGKSRTTTFRMHAAVNEQLMYQLSQVAEWYDDEMVKETLQMMKLKAAIVDGEDKFDLTKMGLLTLYFAGLDHAGHKLGTVVPTHRARLKVIDGMVQQFIEYMSPAVVKNALWIITSDHGQSDLGKLADPSFREHFEDWGLLPEGSIRGHNMIRCKGNLCGGLRSPDDSDCVVGYNAGSAHVYLRASKNAPWEEPPKTEQIHDVAERICADYQDQIDFVLVRDAGGEYKVWDAAKKSTKFIEEFLHDDACVLYTPRYGWSPNDAAFLKECLDGFNCNRSGDLVVFPRYPEVYLESASDKGGHGGLVKNDMLIPLAIARPCLSELKSLTELIAQSVVVDGKKPRPGNRDVRRIIVNYLHQKTAVASGWGLRKIVCRKVKNEETYTYTEERRLSKAEVKTFSSFADPELHTFLESRDPLVPGKNLDLGYTQFKYAIWNETSASGNVVRDSKDVERAIKFTATLPPELIEDDKKFAVKIQAQLDGAPRGTLKDGGLIEAFVRFHGSLWFRWNDADDFHYEIDAVPDQVRVPEKSQELQYKFVDATQWWKLCRGGMPLCLKAEKLDASTPSMKLGVNYEGFAQQVGVPGVNDPTKSRLNQHKQHIQILELDTNKTRALGKDEAVIRLVWGAVAEQPGENGATGRFQRDFEWTMDLYYSRISR